MAATSENDAKQKNIKQLYEITKKLTRKYSKSEKTVSDKEGKTITEIHEQRDRQEEQFEELFNRPISGTSKQLIQTFL